MVNIEEIKKQAKEELYSEERRRLIDQMKQKLKAKKWWHNIVPFKIIIVRRD